MEEKVIEYGWVCPLCGRANSPWKMYCECVDFKEPTSREAIKTSCYTTAATSEPYTAENFLKDLIFGEEK